MKQEFTYEHFIKKVAQNIKKTRNQRKATQEDMMAYGFDYRHYQRIESGRHNMSLHTLFRLAEVFETDINTFFD